MSPRLSVWISFQIKPSQSGRFSGKPSWFSWSFVRRADIRYSCFPTSSLRLIHTSLSVALKLLKAFSFSWPPWQTDPSPRRLCTASSSYFVALSQTFFHIGKIPRQVPTWRWISDEGNKTQTCVWLPRSHRLNHLSASELTLFYLLSWGNTAHTGLGFFFQVDNASSQLDFPKGLLAKCKSCQTKAQRETLVLVMFSLCHTDQGYYFLLKQMRNKNYLSSIVHSIRKCGTKVITLN